MYLMFCFCVCWVSTIYDCHTQIVIKALRCVNDERVLLNTSRFGVSIVDLHELCMGGLCVCVCVCLLMTKMYNT